MHTINMPGFTAEDSLYKTSGHYQTSRQAINFPTHMISTIYPAAMQEEVIVIVEQWPPDPWTPPSWGGHTGPGMPVPTGPGRGGGGGGGRGGGKPPKTPPEDLDKPVFEGCSLRQLRSEKGKRCAERMERDIMNGEKYAHFLRCDGERQGRVVHPDMYCCVQQNEDVTFCSPL